MPTCIYCGTPVEETSANRLNASLEHIFQQSIGGLADLATYDCHEKCNSGLGQTVDSDFINQPLIAMLRQIHGLEGYSGKVPDVTMLAEAVGVGNQGTVVIKPNGQVDTRLRPLVTKKVINPDVEVREISGSLEDARRIFEGMLKKAAADDKVLWTKSGKQIEKFEDILTESPTKELDQFKGQFVVDLGAVARAHLKIAIGFAHLVFGDSWTATRQAEKARTELDGTKISLDTVRIVPPHLRFAIFGKTTGSEGVHRVAILPSESTVQILVSLFGGQIGDYFVELGEMPSGLLETLPPGVRYAAALDILARRTTWFPFEVVLQRFASFVQLAVLAKRGEPK